MTPVTPSGRRDMRSTPGAARSNTTRSRQPASRSSRSARSIGPVRDTGLNVGRSTRRTARRRPSPYPVLIALSIILIVVVLALVSRGGGDADTAVPTATATPESHAVADEVLRDPTPLFAQAQELELRLPVDPAKVTALAFHQASGSAALHMTSLVPDADMELAAELKAVPPLAETTSADPESGGDDVWQGCALRLWRSNRTGAPDTAVDCGADPGTVVYAPISGEVVLVKSYLLYDKYDDYEIHIRPDGHDDIDVVIIHVDEVCVAQGDHVVAGASPVAVVRSMSDKVDLQLAGYTSNGGDHVHVQLNAIESGSDLSGTGGS